MRVQVHRGALLKETLFEAQKGEECGKWLCHIFREIPTKTYKKEPWVPNKRRTKTKPHSDKKNVSENDRKNLVDNHITNPGTAIDKSRTKESQTNISELNNTYLQKPKEANTLFKCNSCPYTTGNQKIWKLHLLSHNFSESEILEKLPPSLKDLTCNYEEDFSKDLDVFLSSLLIS